MSLTHVVTGATGYTGRYITKRLLDGGAEVRSLTGHPNRPNPFGDRVKMFPYDFDDTDALARSMEGADTLFNTYWIRVDYKETTHERVVEQSRALFAAAEKAGVRRVAHISITNPDEDSPLPYFRGKALVERDLRERSLSRAILRPTLIFGREDILLNNIAWMLKKFPIFPIPGSGEYKTQPVYVGDVAELAVRMGAERDDVEMDAVGPEVFSYIELVRLIMDKTGASCRLARVSPSMATLGAKFMGLLLRDIVLTRDEIDGLSSNLLVSKSGSPPPCPTRLSDWLDENGARLGASYQSELARHYR